LASLCIGDCAEAKLMGYANPIRGHLTTVTRGISVSDASPGAQGLPNVDAVYTWVRLAHRVPVKIAIDDVPPGVPLVSDRLHPLRFEIRRILGTKVGSRARNRPS
jgi:multidrug resistance efflux pump